MYLIEQITLLQFCYYFGSLFKNGTDEQTVNIKLRNPQVVSNTEKIQNLWFFYFISPNKEIRTI